jgi:hypothetical protein
MAFQNITEGSKNYIKYVLDLNEVTTRRVAPGSSPTSIYHGHTAGNGMAPAGRRASGMGQGMPGPSGTNSKNPFTPTGPNISPTILLGQSATSIPGRPTITSGGFQSAQQPLDYMTTISQGSALVDYLDKNLPAAAKLSMGMGLLGSTVNANPSKGSVPGGDAMKMVQGALGGVSGAAGNLGNFSNNINNMMTKGSSTYNPLFAKVFQYNNQLAAFDPSDPLVGLRNTFAMMGGQAMRRGVANMAGAQQRGAESASGHPSGLGF